MSIFSIPTFLSAALVMLVFGGGAAVVYAVVHRIWRGDVSGETARVADAVSTRIGVIHAVVIGMMFSNVTAQYIGMIEALESEASALIRLHNEMERRDPERFAPAMAELGGYIHFVVQEQWPALREGRTHANLMGRELLDGVWASVQRFEGGGQQELHRLLDEVEAYRNLRVFDTLGTFLPLFWYAAIIGYLLTVASLCVVPPTKRRLAIVALYGAMVGIVLHGILLMTRPYSVGVGITPVVFERLLEATL